MLAACTAPKVDISPEGQLEIFGPNSQIIPNSLPDDWVLEGVEQGFLFSSLLRIGKLDDAPTLQIASSNKDFALVRRTNATLLASPFLSWSWKVTAPATREHPIRLIVGFSGGTGERRQNKTAFFEFDTGIPPYDRSIALVWGGPDDAPGLIDTNKASPRFIVRSGHTAANRWITENIDLSQLYRRIWPNDDLVNTRVQFVGVASGIRPVPAIAEFSDLALFR